MLKDPHAERLLSFRSGPVCDTLQAHMRSFRHLCRRRNCVSSVHTGDIEKSCRGSAAFVESSAANSYGSYFKKNVKTVHKIVVVLPGIVAAAAVYLLLGLKGRSLWVQWLPVFHLHHLCLPAVRRCFEAICQVMPLRFQACGLVALALV